MTTHRTTAIVAFTVLLTGAATGPAQAATAKVGGTCVKAAAKAGTKSKPLVCTRTKKGLRWIVRVAKAAETTIGKATETTIAKATETTIHKATETTIAKATETTITKK